MSLDNAIVLGLTLGDDASAREIAVEQVRTQMSLGHRVIVVVSASPANRLAGVQRSNRLPASADAFEIARAMIEPELRAGALLTDQLVASGVDASELEPEVYAPLTRGGALDAEPRVVDASALSAALRESPVIVLAGGVGRDFDGRLTSLGADGGSLSSVFVAERLALPVLVQVEPGERTLPRKAALFARRRDQSPRLVGASGLDLGTFEPSQPIPAEESESKPLRVSLLGLGDVGRGVLDELLGAPDRYRVVGIALTSEDARYAPNLTPEIASFDVNEILTRGADVVINLAPEDGAFSLAVEQAKLRGVNVVQSVASLASSPAPAGADDGYRFVAPPSPSAERGWRGVGSRRVSHR